MSNSTLFLVPVVEDLFRKLELDRVVGEAEFANGIQQVEAGLLRVALDAHAAFVKGVPFRIAAANEAEFPHLFRVHVGLADLLTVTLPPAVESFLRRSLAIADSSFVEEGRSSLVRLATAQGSPPVEQSLARFVLFEAVRANLLYAAWRTVGDFEAAGGSTDDIDRIAEDRLELLIAEAPSLGTDVRHFNLVVASAMELLTWHAEALKKMVAQMHRDVAAMLEECAAIERSLRDLDAADALLVRNEMASYLGEQRLSVEELQRQHPVVLDGITRAALDQRLSRLRRRLTAGGKASLPTKDRSSSLCALMAEFESEGVKS